MSIPSKTTTYKKLILLIAIFIFGFISLFELNKVFQNIIYSSKKKIATESQSKQRKTDWKTNHAFRLQAEVGKFFLME